MSTFAKQRPWSHRSSTALVSSSWPCLSIAFPLTCRARSAYCSGSPRRPIRVERSMAAPSSRGLGHGPFKAATRVRIPSGSLPVLVSHGMRWKAPGNPGAFSFFGHGWERICSNARRRLWCRQPDDSHVHGAVHAAGAGLLKEAGKPCRCRGAVRCPPQLLPGSRLVQEDHSRHGRRSNRPRLGDGRTVRRGNGIVAMSREPPPADAFFTRGW